MIILSLQDNVDSQKFCESEGYDVRLGGRVYQFRHCANSKCKLMCVKIFYTKITIIFFTLQSTCFAMIVPSRSLVIAQNIFWSKDVTLSNGTPTINSTISKSVPIVS